MKIQQINYNFIDLSNNKKLMNYYFLSSSFTKHILDEINSGFYREEAFDKIFNKNHENIVIDIGAHIGLFSLYIEPYCKKIYVIEPSPSHFDILNEITRTKDKIIAFNFAVSNYDGECSFFIDNGNTTMNRICHSEPESCKVKCKNLYSFLKQNNIDEIDLLKIDIEGGEDLVILQNDKLKDILKICKNLYLEIHYDNQKPYIDKILSLKEYKIVPSSKLWMGVYFLEK